MYPNHWSLTYFLVLLLALSATASAYELQYADDSRTQKLRWKGKTIPISISSSLLRQNPNIRPDSDVSGAITRSLETWASAANVRFVQLSSEKGSVSLPGKRGDGVSLITVAQTSDNLLLFSGDSTLVSARTRVFFNNKGFITEADIVLNPYQQFSTDGSIGTFDLEATLTHEIGHLLGLDHSFVVGSTMQSNQGVNGVYGLPAFTPRTLGEDDIAGIRAIYGSNNPNKDCCGTVTGNLSDSAGKPFAETQVWFENREDGRVSAGVLTDSNGDFRAEGLPVGEYMLYSRRMGFEKNGFSAFAENLGVVEVARGKLRNIERELKDHTNDFKLHLVGFGGQLSQLAVPISGGRSYIIYIGGKNLDSDELSISFNSPLISFTPGSMIDHRFGEEWSVVSFEVSLSEKIPHGEYSIFVSNSLGGADVLIGCLSVSDFDNSFSSYVIPVEN